MAQKTYNTGRVVGWSSYEEFLKETGADPAQISRYIYQTMVTYGVTRIVELAPGSWSASNGGQFYTQTVRVPGASWGAVPIVGLDYTNYLDVFSDPTTSTEPVEQTDALEKSDLEAAVKNIFTVYVSDENGKEATSPQSDHGYLTFAAYPEILEFDSKISGIPGATMRLIVRGLSLEDLDVDELYFGPQGLVFAGNAFGAGGSHEIKNISDLALNSAGYIWLSSGGAPTPVDYRGLVDHPTGQLLASTFGYLSQDFLNGDGEFTDLGAYGFTYAEYLDAFNDPDIHIVDTQLVAIPVEQRDEYVYLICGTQSYTEYPSAAFPLFVIPVDKQTGKVNIGNYDTFQKPITKKPIDFTRLYDADGDTAATLYIYDKKLPEYMGNWWGTNSVPYSDGLRYVGNNSLSGNWIDDDLSQEPSATFTKIGRHACWKLEEGNFHKGYLYVLHDQVGSDMNGVYLCTKDLDHDSQTYCQLNRCGCFIPWIFPQWYKDKVGSFAFEVDLTGITATVTDGVLYLNGSPVYPGEMAIIGSEADWRCVYVWETIDQGQPRLIVDTSDTPAVSFDATASADIVQVTDQHSNLIRIPRTDWDTARAGETIQVWTSESSSYNLSTSSTEMTVGSFVRVSHEKIGVWGCNKSYRYVVLSCANDYVHLASTMVWVDNPNLTTTVGYPGTYNAVVPRYNADIPDASGSYHYNIKAALATIKAKKFFADFGWDILDYVDTDYQNLSLGEFLQMCVTRSDLTVPRSAENYRNHGITSIFHLYSKEDMNYTAGVIPDPSINQIDSSLTLSAKTEASSFFNTAWYSATTSEGEVDISNKDYPIWVTLAKSNAGEQTMSVSVLDDVNNLLDLTGNEGTVEADVITWLDLLTGLGSGKAVDILHGLRIRKDSSGILCLITPDNARLYLGSDFPTDGVEEGDLAIVDGLYIYDADAWVPVGGGGGGSGNYEDLTHKPKINNHTLTGNKSASELGLQAYISDPEEIGALPDTVGYAASDTPGGPATQAESLTTSSSGSSTQPVYFNQGVPVPVAYTLQSSVPINAVFTDMLAQAPNIGLGANTDLNSVTAWSHFRHVYISAAVSSTLLNYPATPGVDATLWVIPNYRDTETTHRAAQVVVPVNNEAVYIRQLESINPDSPIYNITAWMRFANIPSDAVFTDTTYENKPAASGGTAESLCTTGDKYIWDHKQDALTIDATPTVGSTNPVQSDGVAAALAGKASSADIPALISDISSNTSITSYVDALSKGHYVSFYTSTSVPTDAPVSANCFVEIFVYSSSSALVRVSAVNTNYFATCYEINKASGTWNTSWSASQTGVSIATGTDMNSLDQPGEYYISEATVAASLLNLPESLAGHVTVGGLNAAGRNRLIQTYIPKWSTLGVKHIWVRQLTDTSTWTSWELVYDASREVGLVNRDGKNLLKNVTGTKTVGTIIFQHNEDGTITASGSARTSNTDYTINAALPIKAGTYVLSGCPSGGNNSNTYKLQINGVGYDIGDSFEFRVAADTTLNVYIRIWSGYAPDNLVFKPMICTKSDWIISKEYVPNAMSNLELTQMHTGTQLTGTVDLNDLKSVGTWYGFNAVGSTASHLPVPNGNFNIRVENILIGAVYIRQKCFIARIDNLYTEFIRGLNISQSTLTWTEWQMVSSVGGIGWSLDSGTDLNNINTVGTYQVTNFTISSTIQNGPGTLQPFRLDVKTLNSRTNYMQEITTFDGNTYETILYRRIKTTSGWQPWIQLTKDKPSTYELGTELASNSDLNSVTTPGKWYATSTAIADTIAHSPVSGVAFFGETIPSVAGSRYIQILYPNDDTGRWYKRRYTGSWQVWVEYSGTPVT